MDKPSGTLESLAICWGVAALAGAGAFALLLFLGDWSILQAIFGGAVVAVVIGLILTVTVGRPLPAPLGTGATMRPDAVSRGEPGESALPGTPDRPHAPSPHRVTPETSTVTPGVVRTATAAPEARAAEAAPATRVPSPAPVNAADPAVARPVGATANPVPQAQPAPLQGAIVSPEPPAPATPEDAERPRISRNEAAMAAGLTTMPAPTATTEAQSYNEVDAHQPARGAGAGDGSTHPDGGYPDNPATAREGGAQFMGSGDAAADVAASGPTGGAAPAAAARPAGAVSDARPSGATPTPSTPAGTAADAGAVAMDGAALSTADAGAGNADVEADANAPGSGIFDDDGNQSGRSAAEAAKAFEAADGGAGAVGSAAAAGSADASPGVKPTTLDAPRDGQADDLKRIKGIGPKMEAMCNRLGFWHYDQIAAWTPEEVAWVDSNLEGFKGRVSRDDWVAQAGQLARGEDTAFASRVDKGGMY